MLNRLRAAHRPAAGALAAAAFAAGCGSGTETVAPQCLESSATIEGALRPAPARVAVAGVPISRCFARRADQASVEGLGQVMVDAAASLARRARVAPGSHAATELGYLVGAARRGAGRTEGIYYELERRLEQELAGVDTRSPAYARGEEAGERSG